MSRGRGVDRVGIWWRIPRLNQFNRSSSEVKDLQGRRQAQRNQAPFRPPSLARKVTPVGVRRPVGPLMALSENSNWPTALVRSYFLAARGGVAAKLLTLVSE